MPAAGRHPEPNKENEFLLAWNNRISPLYDKNGF